MRVIVRLLLCASTAVALAGCSSGKGAPDRPISIEEDVARFKPAAEPDLATFYDWGPIKQASVRNQIVTARMYLADMEYHHYETRLTREMQEEGLLATAASLGLTTTATLVPVAQTKSLLSGIATAVTGMDKAYVEKQLLSNTMQALQTQMRADRKTQAGVIYAKMFRGSGSARTLTPIDEYTLPMALSDVDSYYQAGTISSALIGLSKTLANAEKSADEAKTTSGPNPDVVADVKKMAAPSNVSLPMPASIVRTQANRDANYLRLLGLMAPGGKRNPDIDNYVVGLLGAPAVEADAIFQDQTKYGPLYSRISNCIVQRNTGRPCPTGSMQKFR